MRKFGDGSSNSLRDNGTGVTWVSPSGRPAVRPSVRPAVHKNLNVELFSETTIATVTKFGIKVLCDNALQMIWLLMTLTKGQGHQIQGQRSQNETLACFSETIEATVTKFGTKVLCQNALQMIILMMTLTEGQGHKGQGQRSEKETLAFLRNYWSYSQRIWYQGTLRECASDDNT